MMTTVNSPVLELISTNLPRIPMLIVYVVGMVFALATWRRHPTASLLSLLAFTTFLVGSILYAAFFWFVVRSAYDSGVDRPTLMTVGNVLFTLMNVAGWVLILIALFARRPQPPAWSREEPEQYARPYPERGAPPGPAREDIRK